MKITIKNAFHNTSTRLKVIPDTEGWCRLSRAQLMRSRRALCGQACSCSGDLGANGYQHDIDCSEAQEDGSMLVHLRGY